MNEKLEVALELLDPDFCSKNEKFFALYKKGIMLRQSNKADESQQALLEAKKYAGSFETYLLNIEFAKNHYLRGDYESAVKALTDIITLEFDKLITCGADDNPPFQACYELGLIEKQEGLKRNNPRILERALGEFNNARWCYIQLMNIKGVKPVAAIIDKIKSNMRFLESELNVK